MVLTKTTILPTDNPGLAEEMFRKWVEDEPVRLFVVLGADDDAAILAQRADKLTSQSLIPRWVIWARVPEHIANIVKKLKNTELLERNLKTARGFSLSISDEVRDVIEREETPDLARIFASFVESDRP